MDGHPGIGSVAMIGNDVVAATPELTAVLEKAVVDAIMASFEQRPTLHGITEAAVKERYLICLKIVKIARFDCRNGVERISAHMLPWLLAELDGESWEPEARRALFAAGELVDKGTILGPNGRPIV